MDYITIQRTAGWSSYKEYSRWDEVVKLLGLPVIELDNIKDWDKTLALVKGARVHLGIDSVFNHAAAAYKTPAVILFGSTDPIGSGHSTAINIRNSPCTKPCFIEDRYSNGWRCADKCPHDPKCIDTIDPQMIADAVKKFMAPCPICKSAARPTAVTKFNGPYYECPDCKVWRQIKDLPKTCLSSGEPPAEYMSEPDKNANREIAAYISPKFTVSGPHLSIGSKYPMLAHWLQERHGRKCVAIDMIPEVVKLGAELGVEAYQCDAEQGIPGGPYASMDMVHVLEHIYNPIETLNKFADAMVPGGVLFIRSPNYDAAGIERDYVAHLYEIHPYIYGEASFKRLIEMVPKFKLLSCHGWAPGQMDCFLEKV